VLDAQQEGVGPAAVETCTRSASLTPERHPARAPTLTIGPKRIEPHKAGKTG